MGSKLSDMVRELNAGIDGLVAEDGRPTTKKTRVVAHSQQVVRVDRERREPVSESSIKRVLEILKEELNQCDAIIVADYGKGVVTGELMDGILSLTRGSQIILAVDPAAQNMPFYKDVTLVTPNTNEAQLMSGVHIHNEQSLELAGTRLRKELGCRIVLITQGDKGMTLFESNDRLTHIPTVARKVFDVSGAGDTVTGTFTLALAARLTPKQAAVLANVAAGIVVGEVGTATVPASKLKETLSGSKGWFD
jgi:D-beta-D-heptose 7-phosphate kinase/D-beta-D-heptose 1-phosphate adenosyltransferase